MNKEKNINLAYVGSNKNAKYRLFCFPFAGGGASVFARWGNVLQQYDIQIMPIQLPGRENRYTERYNNNIIDIAKNVAEGIKEYLDRPFAVFGHSMGGCLAYEFVKYLETVMKMKPSGMYVSCTVAPKYIVPCIFGDVDKESTYISEDVLFQLIKRFCGMDVNLLEIKEYYDYFVPILKRDFTLIKNYKPSHNDMISSDIHVLWGDKDPDMVDKNINPWKTYSNTVKYKKMKGGHFYIKHNIQEICDYIALNTIYDIERKKL